MLDLFNIPTPQTANYQEFFAGGSASSVRSSWAKPRGASMVRFLLIGAGGNGGNGSSTAGGGGGGSGAVTSWIGPAMFVPDILGVLVGGNIAAGGYGSYISYFTNDYNLILIANPGSNGATSAGGNGGAAMPVNQFTACGIFTSVAGQAGGAGSSSTSGTGPGTSATTFLSGGGGGAGGAAGTGGNVVPNYGYQNLPAAAAGGTVAGANGYFITQPILVGCGGAGGTTSTSVGTAGGRGGIGCGGGGSGEDGNSGGRGGNGAVFIWAW